VKRINLMRYGTVRWLVTMIVIAIIQRYRANLVHAASLRTSGWFDPQPHPVAGPGEHQVHASDTRASGAEGNGAGGL
jgi:hypothetical protein